MESTIEDYSRPGRMADGAMPAMMPAEFTSQARQVLGPDKLLVIGLAVVADVDRGRAKSWDTESVGLGRRGLSCAASMARLGYSAQEIAEVSDRLVDAIVGHRAWPSSAPVLCGLSLIDSTSSAAEVEEVRGS